MTFLPRCGQCPGCATGGRMPCGPGSASNSAGELLGGGRRLTRDGDPLHHHLGVSAFATHAVVDARSVVAVDDDVPPDVAAVLGCASRAAAPSSMPRHPSPARASWSSGSVGWAWPPCSPRSRWAAGTSWRSTESRRSATTRASSGRPRSSTQPSSRRAEVRCDVVVEAAGQRPGLRGRTGGHRPGWTNRHRRPPSPGRARASRPSSWWPRPGRWSAATSDLRCRPGTSRCSRSGGARGPPGRRPGLLPHRARRRQPGHGRARCRRSSAADHRALRRGTSGHDPYSGDRRTKSGDEPLPEAVVRGAPLRRNRPRSRDVRDLGRCAPTADRPRSTAMVTVRTSWWRRMVSRRCGCRGLRGRFRCRRGRRVVRVRRAGSDVVVLVGDVVGVLVGDEVGVLVGDVTWACSSAAARC